MEPGLSVALQLRIAGKFCSRAAANIVLGSAIGIAGLLAIQFVSRDLEICQHRRSAPYRFGSIVDSSGHPAVFPDAAPGSGDTALGADHQSAVADPDDGRQPVCLQAVEGKGAIRQFQAAWRARAGPGCRRCCGKPRQGTEHQQ